MPDNNTEETLIYYDNEIISQDFSASDVPWDKGQLLYNLWQSKKAGRDFPARRDFNPMEMHKCLPWMILLNIEDDQETFRIQVMGTELENIIGRKGEGMTTEGLPGGEILKSRFKHILNSRKPLLVENRPLDWAGKEYLNYDVMILPLASDGTTIDKFFFLLKVHMRAAYH